MYARGVLTNWKQPGLDCKVTNKAIDALTSNKRGATYQIVEFSPVL